MLSKLFFITISLFLSTLIGLYFLKPTPPPSSTTTPPPSTHPLLSPSPSPPNPYAQWQLYQNPKHDYQFKYSPQWQLNDSLPQANQYDIVLLQSHQTPLVEIAWLQGESAPQTIEEWYHRLRRQSPNSALVRTTNFGQQDIYAVLLSTPDHTSFYFLHRGLPFRLRIFGSPFSQLSPELRYFLNTFSFL